MDTAPVFFSHLVRELFPLVNFVILVVIIFMSRRWTGISISARQEVMEGQVSMLQGSVRKLELDGHHVAREAQDANAHVIKELHALTRAIDDLLTLRQSIRTLEDRMDVTERHFETCPLRVEDKPDA